MSTLIFSVSVHGVPDYRFSYTWPLFTSWDDGTELATCHARANSLKRCPTQRRITHRYLLSPSMSLTALHKPCETHLWTTNREPQLNDAGPHHAGRVRMLAALVGILERSVCTKLGSQYYALLRKHAITNKDFRRVRQALQEHPETIHAHEIEFNPSHSPRC